MTIEQTDTQELRLPWAGKRIRLEHVDDELSHLWRMSADNVRTAQNVNVRTSVLNFIICAPDLESAKQAHTIVRDLSSTHIARVILMILDTSEAAPPGVSSWVTLRSFSIISDMMRHSFEQVTLLIRGTAVSSAATFLQSLLKPDLPTYLWWINDPPRDLAVFERMLTISSRVIVDSDTFFRPERSLKELSSFIKNSSSHAFSDLNWGRITQWRELVAQFFDTAEYQPYLNGITTIEIEHAVAPSARQTRTAQGDISPNPTRTLLLAGWLKTRLGWQLVSGHGQNEYNTDTGLYTWHVDRRDGSGKLVIRPRIQANIPSGSLCMIRLTSTLADNDSATFTINTEDDQYHVLTSVEMADRTRPPRMVSLRANHKESQLLHDELEIMGHDHLYEETLHEVARLLSEQ